MNLLQHGIQKIYYPQKHNLLIKFQYLQLEAESDCYKGVLSFLIGLRLQTLLGP